MITTDRAALGRAAQLARGCRWAFGTLGDPYAMLLCGHDDDPWRYYDRIREADPDLFHSRTGDRVVTGYARAAEVLDDPGFTRAAGDAPEWAAPFEFPAAPPPVPLPEPERLVPEYTAVLPGPGRHVDLLRDFAREGALRSALALLDLPVGQVEQLREPALAWRVAWDARLSPQRLAVIEAAEATRDALEHPLLGGGVEMAANAVCRSILAARHAGLAERLADDPALADPIAAEALRVDPPVHLERRTANTDRELAGQRIEAGTHVIVAVAAANRDPAVFGEPDRFDPHRADGSARLTAERGCPDDLDGFALLQVRAALRAVAPVLPRLALPGPVRCRRRSPVLRGLSGCPAVL